MCFSEIREQYNTSSKTLPFLQFSEFAQLSGVCTCILHFNSWLLTEYKDARQRNQMYQYNETNVKHYSFSLLRIKGLYLHASSTTCLSSGVAAQTAFGILHAYKVSWMWLWKQQPCHIQLILYVCNIPNAVCEAPPEDEKVMLETCRGLWFSINWLKSASRWFRYTDILWCTISTTLRKPNVVIIRIHCDFHEL
jgi:hypothetical protein